MLAGERASFWRENVVAVVILLRVLTSVVVAGTSLLEVLPFSNLERAQRPSITITVLTFLVKNSRMKNSGGFIF